MTEYRMPDQRPGQNDGRGQNSVPGEGRKRPGMGARFFIAGILTGVLICLLGGAYAAGALLHSGKLSWEGTGGMAALPSEPSETRTPGSAVRSESIRKLRQIEELIDSVYYYADDTSREQKESGLYRGLMESLEDPYSVYYNEDELAELDAETEGVYYGIGAYVSWNTDSDAPVITGTIRQSPAEAAGLEAGDIIYKVEGEETMGSDLETVVSMIRGPEGTPVHLTLYREGNPDYLEVQIIRGKVSSETVLSEMLENQIGYIAIAEFDDVTSGQFEEALASLREQGMKGMILDLRGNPGGNVTTVTEIAEQLLPEGLIFYYEDRDGERTEYSASGKHAFSLPLVVLVNDYSASASEILSGAIQDAGIGTLVGTQTYGKGVVQTVYDLQDGTAVKLTTAAYFTRNGRDINHVGITPDVVLPLDAEAYREDGTDNQMDKAKELLLKELGK
ncbi:S41 family peptidase [Lachnoclostridium sp. Marseille-P6806]|uniref:S41 family peptidase n=1 Tax=Lachnoclostridium sp. Marseille-P6806 TaxID=2364793 RepID=UPI00102F4BE0|nr:S41 family peptidase [Lachnoclostridium sp. Marseille-P6806]